MDILVHVEEVPLALVFRHTRVVAHAPLLECLHHDTAVFPRTEGRGARSVIDVFGQVRRIHQIVGAVAPSHPGESRMTDRIAAVSLRNMVCDFYVGKSSQMAAYFKIFHIFA